MSDLILGTSAINENEPCFKLCEMNLQSPGSKGWHRYQIIEVIRNDKPAEFRIDLGLAKKFKREQFRIIGGVKDPKTGRGEALHTVGELINMANELREKPVCDKRELAQIN